MAFMDIVIGMVLLLFMASGFRNGFLKKMIGLVCLIASLVIATKFSADLSELITTNLNVSLSKSTGFFLSFILIVLGITLIQSILYRMIFKEISEAMWNKLLGLVMGLVEGGLAISITLIVLSIYLDMPSIETKQTSELYKPVKNFAPMVFDQVNSYLPESEDFFYSVTNAVTEQLKKVEKK